MSEEQKNAFDRICSKMNVAIYTENIEILQQVYHEMTVQAEGLGIYGAAIQYIAEELKHFLPNLDNAGN